MASISPGVRSSIFGLRFSIVVLFVRTARRGGPGGIVIPGITITVMVRIPLSPEQRAAGLALGAELRAARAGRPMTVVADAAGISVETLRKIETGRIPTPSFATVVAVAAAVDLSLDLLARPTRRAQPAGQDVIWPAPEPE